MRIINRRVHGVLDYVVGILLILSPGIFGLEAGTSQAAIPVFLGWSALAYSLLTKYELGLLRLIPFRGHLTLDVLSGLTLALSPWLFGFADRVWMPHLIVGLFEIAAVLMTRTSASALGDVGRDARAH